MVLVGNDSHSMEMTTRRRRLLSSFLLIVSSVARTVSFKSSEHSMGGRWFFDWNCFESLTIHFCLEHSVEKKKAENGTWPSIFQRLFRAAPMSASTKPIPPTFRLEISMTSIAKIEVCPERSPFCLSARRLGKFCAITGSNFPKSRYVKYSAISTKSYPIPFIADKSRICYSEKRYVWWSRLQNGARWCLIRRVSIFSHFMCTSHYDLSTWFDRWLDPTNYGGCVNNLRCRLLRRVSWHTCSHFPAAILLVSRFREPLVLLQWQNCYLVQISLTIHVLDLTFFFPRYFRESASICNHRCRSFPAYS